MRLSDWGVHGVDKKKSSGSVNGRLLPIVYEQVVLNRVPYLYYGA